MDDVIQLVSQFEFRNECWVLFIPLALMAVDVLTGLIKAWSQKSFKSSIMRSGLAKKAGEILILLMGEILSYGMMLPPIIMNCVSFYIIFMESASVLENVDTLGVPIPKFVKEAINNVDTKIGTSEIEDDKKE